MTQKPASHHAPKASQTGCWLRLAPLRWPAEDQLDGGEAMLRLQKLHPQYDRLEPSEEIVENGQVMSPHLHLVMHQVVENQLRDDQPSFVAETITHLETHGLTRHEARHVVMDALVRQMHSMLSTETRFDEEAYRNGLREAERRWLDAQRR